MSEPKEIKKPRWLTLAVLPPGFGIYYVAATWDAATAAERARIVALLRALAGAEATPGWDKNEAAALALAADRIEKGEG